MMVAQVDNDPKDPQSAQIFAGMEFLILPDASQDDARQGQERLLRVSPLPRIMLRISLAHQRPVRWRVRYQ